jgi:hypothetical protein
MLCTCRLEHGGGSASSVCPQCVEEAEAEVRKNFLKRDKGIAKTAESLVYTNKAAVEDIFKTTEAFTKTKKKKKKGCFLLCCARCCVDS